MALHPRTGNLSVATLTILGLVGSLSSVPLRADVWVFEPSISLDQRFDDNYYLIADGDGSLSATRAVGELGLSRETEATSYSGLVRVDALLTTSNDYGDEGLDSNQIAAFEAVHRTARSRYGALFTFTQDTPSRDIAADLSEDSLATDTSFDLTEFSNVARKQITFEPSYQYDLSRRLEFDTSLTLTSVDHELPDSQDVIYQRYLETFERQEDGSFNGTPLSYDEVTIDDVVTPFKASGELDDYDEAEFDIGFKYKLTPITTVSTTLAYSYYEGEVEPDAYAIIDYDDEEADPDYPFDIRRNPRRESISTTTTFKLGAEHALTPTLRVGGDVGVYTNTTDLTDTLRQEDRPGEDISERVAALETESDGWLASVSMRYDAGRTRYVARFAVDVEPSSSGTQVETNELTGEFYHTLSPRLDFQLRGRAYEPDRLGAVAEDSYSRRFISIEPKIQWQLAREWTVAAAYRYRRQKARVDPVSAESNAILLSLKYTPSSRVRDAVEANGL